MKFKLFGIFIFLLIHCVVFAQTKSISGIVKDGADGTPLPGVTVAIKGTTKGTSTNADGEFTLSAAVGDSLQVSYIGKNTAYVVIGARNVVEVLLYDDAQMLEEVTVVAFGTQKKESVVASIQTVKVSDLKVSSSNLSTALAGRVAGLISFQTSGEPGRDNAAFFVRGVTTFGYKSDPLILIDGFEMTTDDLAKMRPDDIESFSVLKDASATVLYGSRAANGIIMITTKSGREGAAKVSIRIDNHIATPTKIPKMADGVTYMRMYNEGRMTRNPLIGPYYSEQKIQSTINGENPMIYPNVDWYDEIFKSSTINTKANMSVEGGGPVAKYYLSAGYDHETGLLNVDPRNNYNNNININRFSLRTNVTFKLSPTTTLDTRISGVFDKRTGPALSTSDIFFSIMNSNPVDFPAVYEPDKSNEFTTHTLFGSSYIDASRKSNPYAEMTRGYSDYNKSNILAQISLNQDLGMITEGLKAQLKASVNTESEYEATRMYNPYYYDLESYNQITGEHILWCLNPTTGQSSLGDVRPWRNSFFKYYFEGRLNWGKSFGDNNIGLMAVGTMEEHMLTAGNSTSIYETLPEKNMGVSGRLTYDYDSRYFLELAFGYNGSEKFDGDKRFGFFPSLAGGWLLSNESFWDPLKDLVSTLKFKGSIGKIGNDAISGRAGRFFYLSDISVGTGGGYRWGENFTNEFGGYRINRYANPNISWETSLKWNAGVELGFFKEKLKIQAEMFGEDRTNIYMVRENFPSTAGLEASVSGNVGRLKAKGFDGSIEYQHIVNRDIFIKGTGNFTYSTNKYVELDEKDYPDEYRKRLGHNKDQWWGLIAERLFIDDEEIANSPRQDFGSYMAGDIKYKDVNGDGVVNENDMVPLGFPVQPSIQYGFGLSTGYKDWDFSFFFQGNARVSIFIHPGVGGSDGVEGIAPLYGRRNALDIVAKDYWSETNPNAYAFWPRLSASPLANNMQTSSWWLRDGGFMRLKSVELAYNVKALEKFKVYGCRVYISGENLLTFSKFKLWDPELRRKGLAYPTNTRYNIGLQLQF